MAKLKAIWETKTVGLSCGWCLTDIETMSAGQIKHLGRANIKCRSCGGINYLPSDLLGQVQTAKAKIDPDNPPGRASAWDAIVSNQMLKRAMEIAIAGRHTLTYVGRKENGWAYVLEVLGAERAKHIQRCPCGGLYDDEMYCACSLQDIEEHRASNKYIQALASDILVEAVTPRAEEAFAIGEPYTSVLTRIKRVREAQIFGPAARMDVRTTEPTFAILNAARLRLSFTTETIKSTQRVAVTIAALEGHDLVKAWHMAEAISYRTALTDIP
jgi:predicted ATPase with chaperone activity